MHQDAIDEASCAMGLSLGEYSALCFAGAMSFEDGVKVTKVRGEAMQAAADLTESGMASVIGLDMEKVGRAEWGAVTDTVCYIMPNGTVSGPPVK